jgi:hypothetical protein
MAAVGGEQEVQRVKVEPASTHPAPLRRSPSLACLLLGARRAIATIPRFQISGAVPNRALMLGTPNTCDSSSGRRSMQQPWL